MRLQRQRSPGSTQIPFQGLDPESIKKKVRCVVFDAVRQS
jgi:hypothetical protein